MTDDVVARLRRLAGAVRDDSRYPTAVPWTAVEDDDGYWSVNAVGDGARTPLHQHITSGPMEHTHRYIAAVSPDVVTALLDVVEAARNMRAHIEGGMEDGSHLPADLCFRQLQDRLDRLNATEAPDR